MGEHLSIRSSVESWLVYTEKRIVGMKTSAGSLFTAHEFGNRHYIVGYDNVEIQAHLFPPRAIGIGRGPETKRLALFVRFIDKRPYFLQGAACDRSVTVPRGVIAEARADHSNAGKLVGCVWHAGSAIDRDEGWIIFPYLRSGDVSADHKMQAST